MNKVALIGRLTADPEITYTQSEMMIAKYRLAVDRFKKDSGADFIPCVAFDKKAQFANSYFRKGMKVAVIGRIQTGSYENRDGQKVYTTDIIVDEQEFCESKSQSQEAPEPKPENDGFMNIPDNIDEELPFN